MKRTDQMFLSFPEELGKNIRDTAERDMRKYSDQVNFLVRLGLVTRRLMFGNRRFAKFSQDILLEMGMAS